jgi:hypothetical protein
MPVLFLFIIGASALGLTTIAMLDGSTRTMVLFIEALWVFVVGRHMFHTVRQVPILVAPLIVPIALSLSSVGSPAWRTGLIHEDALVLCVAIVVCTVIALQLSHMRRSLFSSHMDTLIDVEHTAWITTGLYAITFVWLLSHALVPGDAESGTLIAISVYLFVASLLYSVARVTNAFPRRSWWKRLISL